MGIYLKDAHVGSVYLKVSLLVGMYLEDADFACNALAGVWLSEFALLERLDRHLLLRQQVCVCPAACSVGFT